MEDKQFQHHRRFYFKKLTGDILERAKNRTLSWYDIVGYYKIDEDILIEFKDNIPFYYLVQFQDLNGYSKEIQLFILYEVLKENKPNIYYRDKYFTKYMREKFEVLNMLS